MVNSIINSIRLTVNGKSSTVRVTNNGSLNCGKCPEEISKPMKVAVMGCVVNGSGEAEDADVGIACGKVKGLCGSFNNKDKGNECLIIS